VAVWLLCLAPMTWMWYQLAMGQIRGEWIKQITHRTGYWGLVILVATLAVTPLRRLGGWNWLQPYRRTLGLFTFFYISVHFLIYVFLDRQLQFDFAFAAREMLEDIAKRPYITVGFTGFVLMIPLALTSTKNSIRRLGKRWVALHSLIYLTALAGIVHFLWSQKADYIRPTSMGLALVVLLAIRLIPRTVLARLRDPKGSTAPHSDAQPATGA
jgi:sulfoxide reductase heme-binding subunit YedZ